MKIKYLGTAAAEGWPGLFCTCDTCRKARLLKGKNLRSRSQVLLNDNLLVDFGPDTYYHAITQNLNLSQVETVLLTHSHMDHFYPTDLILRGVPYAYGREANKMTLYGNEACEHKYTAMLKEEDDTANLPQCIDFRTIQAQRTFNASGYRILPLQASHDPRENCLLFGLTDEHNKSLFYGNDTGYMTEETWEQMKSFRFDLVSLDCTMGGTPGCASHMGMGENTKVRERMLTLGCADESTLFVMTHFSHNGGLMHEELVSKGKDLGFLIAYDGMELEI